MAIDQTRDENIESDRIINRKADYVSNQIAIMTIL